MHSLLGQRKSLLRSLLRLDVAWVPKLLCMSLQCVYIIYMYNAVQCILCCRTDEYIVCTDSVGLKLRHQTMLECKVRGPVARCGAEFWNRIGERSMFDPSKDLQDFVGSELLRFSAVYEQYRPALGDAMKEIQAAASGISLLLLRKRRKRGFLKAVVLEQTDVEVVSCIGEEKKSKAGYTASSGATNATQLKQQRPIKMRSIAFEQSVLEPSHQQPMSIEELLESLGGSCSADPLSPVFKRAGAKVMGYPQFVLEMRDALQVRASEPRSDL